jgi:TPP-dependent pyruvate/acetoin dehydrogenase alpha subunit
MGGLACYHLEVGREMAAMGYVASIWEEDDSVLSTD